MTHLLSLHRGAPEPLPALQAFKEPRPVQSITAATDHVIEGFIFQIPSIARHRHLRDALVTAKRLIDEQSRFNNMKVEKLIESVVSKATFRNAADVIMDHCSVRLDGAWRPLSDEKIQSRVFDQNFAIPLILTMRAMSVCKP